LPKVVILSAGLLTVGPFLCGCRPRPSLDRSL